MENKITHNVPARRFEFCQDDLVAYISYSPGDGFIDIVSTRVPKELEGGGIASALTKEVLHYALSNKLKVFPSCSFAKTYIDRHPEYHSLLKE